MAKNIYVGNLPFSVTEADLRDMFAQHGPVEKANLIMDRDTGRPRGFGFVEMENQADAETAIKELDGMEMDGRALKVNEARERESRPRRQSNW